MHALTEGTVRASFVNTTRKEVSDLNLPAGFADLEWDRLDLLGGRDPKLAKRAYVVVPTPEGVVGVLRDSSSGFEGKLWASPLSPAWLRTET